MDRCGLLWCFISCLDCHSDGTHSLQRIRWWARNKIIYILVGLRVRKCSAFITIKHTLYTFHEGRMIHWLVLKWLWAVFYLIEMEEQQAAVTRLEVYVMRYSLLFRAIFGRWVHSWIHQGVTRAHHPYSSSAGRRKCWKNQHAAQRFSTDHLSTFHTSQHLVCHHLISSTLSVYPICSSQSLHLCLYCYCFSSKANLQMFFLLLREQFIQQ